MGMPAPFHRWFHGAHGVKLMRRSILEFAGIAPVRITLNGGAAGLSQPRVDDWGARMRQLGSVAH